MKVVITGSLGNVGKPLTQNLVGMGHSVTVISSNSARQKEIESLGAKAAVGKLENADFLVATFRGAGAVYLMEAFATEKYLDNTNDFIDEVSKIVNNYVQAILKAGVKRIVHLSSV